MHRCWAIAVTLSCAVGLGCGAEGAPAAPEADPEPLAVTSVVAAECKAPCPSPRVCTTRTVDYGAYGATPTEACRNVHRALQDFCWDGTGHDCCSMRVDCDVCRQVPAGYWCEIKHYGRCEVP